VDFPLDWLKYSPPDPVGFLPMAGLPATYRLFGGVAKTQQKGQVVERLKRTIYHIKLR
jgi:hypothetical protein